MKEDITCFDTETTGLVQACECSLEFQPRVFEVYVVRLNKKFKVLDEFEALINPEILIPTFISKMTGVYDTDVSDKPRFKKFIKPIQSIFKNAKVNIAHNLTFDEYMILFEMLRAGINDFKFPPIKFCTVEQSMHLMGYRLSNSELYEELTKKPYGNGAHRAKYDTLKTLKSAKILMKDLKKCF